MEKRARRWLFGVLMGFGYLLVALLLMFLFAEPKFHSPPGASRDTGSYRGGSMGLLEEAFGDSERGRPAAAAMGVPTRTEGANSDFMLEWQDEEEASEEAVRRWVEGLQGDDKMELVAFATWHPAADDDVGGGADWRAPVVFRDAETLEALDGAALDGMGVPDGFRTVRPPERYVTPVLRMLFRVEGIEFPRVMSADVGDAVTGAQVSYDLDSWGEVEPSVAFGGGWMRYDVALLMWHDRPLRVLVRVLTGEPIRAELAREPGAQVVFGDSLRVQWVGVEEGDVNVRGYGMGSFEPSSVVPAEAREALKERLDDEPVAAWVEVEAAKPGEPVKREVLLRASSPGYLREHAGLVMPNRRVQWNWRNEGGSGASLVAIDDPGGAEPLPLVVVPEVAELSFELPGIPDAPTKTVPENLFDVVMPRVTLDESSRSAEDELIGLLSVAAQVEWEHKNLWESGDPPPELPADRTFRNTTPRELLLWYLEVTPGSRVRYEEEELYLELNEERRSFSEWWDDVAPSWLTF